MSEIANFGTIGVAHITQRKRITEAQVASAVAAYLAHGGHIQRLPPMTVTPLLRATCIESEIDALASLLPDDGVRYQRQQPSPVAPPINAQHVLAVLRAHGPATTQALMARTGATCRNLGSALAALSRCNIVKRANQSAPWEVL